MRPPLLFALFLALAACAPVAPSPPGPTPADAGVGSPFFGAVLDCTYDASPAAKQYIAESVYTCLAAPAPDHGDKFLSDLRTLVTMTTIGCQARDEGMQRSKRVADGTATADDIAVATNARAWLRATRVSFK